jgi:hypothetical protein
MFKMSVGAFTLLHVAISLVAIASGFYVVIIGLLSARLLPVFNGIFLTTTLATSVTGFLFPFKGFTPAIGVGLLSLALLSTAFIALFRHAWRNSWRWIYVVSVVGALYLNAFVAVVQAFQKIPSLNALAPTGTEPAFIVAQSLLLATFGFLGLISLRRFHPTNPASPYP